MTARPRLVRSVPYWVLVVGSVASGAVGLWLTLDKLGVMTDRILDETATGVDVYVGQSWVVLGAILIGTGLVGLALALTLAAGASLVKRAEPAVVLAEPFDDADDETDDVIVASAEEGGPVLRGFRRRAGGNNGRNGQGGALGVGRDGVERLDRGQDGEHAEAADDDRREQKPRD